MDQVIEAVEQEERVACWELVIEQAPSGLIELCEKASGFFWRWRSKPEHLVSLLGVAEEREARKAWRFHETAEAIDHLLHCTGIAFEGHCGLVPHTGRAS